jgi:hypothetical protein
VAEADEGRLGIGRIAHLAAQTTTLDFHQSLPVPAENGGGRMAQSISVC